MKRTPRLLTLTTLAVALTTAGCSYPNELRVTEYGANSALSWLVGAELGGCRVVSKGNVKATVTYKGEKCTVTWKAK